MRGVGLAWRRLSHARSRTIAAVAGMAAAVLLLFTQLGFYAACARSATLVYDLFAFDVVLVSPHYLSVNDAPAFDRSRLAAAAATPGVAAVAPLRLAGLPWRDPEGGRERSVLVVGVDPAAAGIAAPELAVAARSLGRRDSALVDLVRHPSYAALAPEATIEVAGRRLDTTGAFSNGAGFAAKAVLLVGDVTFERLTGATRDDVDVGLVRLDPGVEVAAAVAGLRRRLPADVEVWSRRKLFRREGSFYLNQKPVGLMFRSGVILAVLVGGAILYQTLSSGIRNSVGELATLAAIGYRPLAVRRLVVAEGLLLALGGFVPAALLSLLLYAGLRAATLLPLAMTWGRLATVFAATTLFAVVASVLALRHLERIDPAELFG